jgi:acyl-coenzyme A synthetase/AMP-(fatty) acid ligase
LTRLTDPLGTPSRTAPSVDAPGLRRHLPALPARFLKQAVELVEEIPKSPSGKIVRRVLIDRERTAAMAG